MHVHGPKGALDELVMRMSRRSHVPCTYRPVSDLSVIMIGIDRDGDGRDFLSYAIHGTCGCSMRRALDTGPDNLGFRDGGWGIAVGWVTGWRHGGATTLCASATELGIDIEAYSYGFDGDSVGLREHLWYSRDGSVSVYEEFTADDGQDKHDTNATHKMESMVWHV